TVASMPVRFVSSGSVPMNAPDFTQAAEASVNAVVHIKTRVEEKYDQLNYDPFHQFFYGQPQQRIQQGSGSGVIIDKNGYIVTNNHVIDGASEIQVVLNDKRTYSAELVGADPQTDLALLKIKEKDLPIMPYGNSDNVKVGEWCLAVGNPFNLNSTVTAGIISAKGRNINILENDPSRGMFPIESFIQTDAAVNPGNSGGALVSTTGELIGINSAIASQNGAYIGYSFAIPVNIVKKVVADLAELGVVQRAFIGVSIHDIDSKFAEEKGLKNLNGVYVSGLSENGSAEQAGVEIGDVITKVEEIDVKNVAELQEQVGKYRPGDKIKVSLVRSGKEMNLPVVLKNKEGNIGIVKKEKPAEKPIFTLGAAFEQVTKEEMTRLKISNGVRISKLQNGKMAAAGIREGFIVTSIDKKKVNNIDDVESALKNKQGGVLIEGIYPNGMRAYYGFGL
ncbi:MAG TPA: Do family serine endopeptidase, partial [Bacteroidia bacterium]|nr:Do family serine endopeptidase [Bacteroidia bacterium]